MFAAVFSVITCTLMDVGITEVLETAQESGTLLASKDKKQIYN